MSADNSNPPRWTDTPSVQREGFDKVPVFLALIGTLVFLVILVIAATAWFRHEAIALQNSVGSEVHYPELRATEIQAQEKLNRYLPLDDEGTTFRIPIDRAIDVMVSDPSSPAPLTDEVLF